MTWREDLRRVDFAGKKLIGASFRGVPFFVEAGERTGGRRQVVHKFPFKADPFVEDMGADSHSFPIEGYVIGDDYLVQRDALLRALENTAGPGELVHPSYGVKRASVGPVRVREAKADGGMAVFTIEFYEAPAQDFTPTEVVDRAARADTSATAAITASRAELVSKFDPVGMPGFALKSASAVLDNMATGLESRLARITTSTQEAATMSSTVKIITSQVSSLVQDPGAAFDAFRSAITALADTIAEAPGEVAAALVEAYGTDPGPTVIVTTATRERELANQQAMTAALRRVLVIEAGRLAPLADYESIDQATAARDVIARLLEEQAAVADDTTYPTLVTLRSDVLRAVPGDDLNARVVKVSRSTAVPSLLLAYQLYGSVDQEADIIARNGVSHPGFIAGELEVLSDG